VLRLPDLIGAWRNRYYVNPFRHSTHLEVGRVDQGVDYHGEGRIDAIGRCRVVAIGGAGWPGNMYLHLRLLRGRHKGRYVYIAEGIEPTCVPSQVVRKGRQVAHFKADAAPGEYPGIEIGWGSPITNLTLAAQTEQPLPPGNADTRAGQCFARFLHHHGARAPAVPNQAHGAEYPV
jgi:hypothetical protein